MKNLNSKALKRLVTVHAAIAALALLMLAYKWASEVLAKAFFRLPYCLTHQLFHLYCPLCGGTRAAAALLRLDVVSALRYNPLVVAFALGLVIYDVVALVRIFKGKDLPNIKFNWLAVTLAVVGYFVLRNILMIAFGIDPLGELLPYYVS